MPLTIYYDGDCPFCSRYVALMRLRDAVGTVELVDLRADPKRRAMLEAEGFNLDEGMVVEQGTQKLGGADAANLLGTLSRPSGLFNRINHMVMGHERLAALIYPILRAGRWLVLFLLGRHGFVARDEGIRARQQVFALFFALFSLFHVLNYSFEYGRFPPGLDLIAIGVCAIALLFRPQSARLLFILMAVSTISTIIEAPIGSNHTMVRSILLLGYWLAFCWTMAEGQAWDRVFARFAPAGQGALLVMYFFGIFHKINTDFLNPATSCAVALWQQMPPPLAMIDFPAMHYLAIYGTFAVEGVIAILLLLPRYRHIGIVCGIAFHGLLSLSGYAMYISFTTLSMALHTLFLTESAAQRILAAPETRFVRQRLATPLYLFALILLFVCILVMALLSQYTAVTLLLVPLIAPFCYVVIRYGAPETGAAAKLRTDRVGWGIAGFTSLLFIANCMMPYAGLKTAQAVNMFANLRLEAGVSNHLIFRQPPSLFHYLDDVVTFTSVDGEGSLNWYLQSGAGMVYYELLNVLERNSHAKVSYRRDGVLFENMDAQALSSDIKTMLHPLLVRKWLHFQPVNLHVPEPCTL